ncbi:MAG: HEPN domain-containing protein [Defluviitaleaceae bacterium]|nr:HEPN domain-containing protein [Defluviitaleaceae bacterium]MCL2263393.1 HEPN domain-containing protein [Defluviitaleaceae bacterium]
MSASVKYRLDIADNDIETAKALLKTGRYLYVGFMCHQAIEKSLKAVIARACAEGEIPPKIHNLTRLASIDIEPVLLDTTQDKSGFVKHVFKTGQIIYQA